MLSAYNSDMQEEVFIDLRTGALYLYVGKIEVCISNDWKATLSRSRLDFLIRQGVLESLGKL